jgi:hypothetical protein
MENMFIVSSQIVVILMIMYLIRIATCSVSGINRQGSHFGFAE